MTRRLPNASPAAAGAKRCAIYTRKSTTIGLDQEFNSLDAQRETCLRYIESQPGWTFAGKSYDDGGFTGSNTDRPAFQRLMADVEAGTIDIIIVYKLDRFSRSLLDFLQTQKRLEKVGCAFVAVTQHFNTADAMGRLILNVLMSFAQFEREMTSERIRDKLAASRRKGKWTGGHAPVGYEVRDKRLAINELDATAVREAFELFEQHGKLALVAELLNERGAARPARNGSAARWTKVAVLRLLKNATYAGLVAYGGELYPGEHPAIVERAAFDRVQAILEGRRTARTTHGNNPDYLLRGLLRCGKCGAMMVPASTRKAGREYRYYRCSERNKNGASECTATNLSARTVEEHVAGSVARAASDPGLVAEVRDALDARLTKRRQVVETECAELPARIAAASAKASRLLDGLTELTGKARQLAEQRLQEQGQHLAALEQRLAEAEHAQRALQIEQVDADWVARTLADFPRVWDKLTAENRGRLLRALVDEVVVHDDDDTVEVRLARLEEAVA